MKIWAILLLFMVTATVLLSCRDLDKQSASELAAGLANEECFKLYEKKPFNATDYEAESSEGHWTLAKLDKIKKETDKMENNLNIPEKLDE